jgi:hypothetical protein
MYTKDGHQREATKTNNTGGSQVNRAWLLEATSKDNSETFDDYRTPPLIMNNETALVDSGCTGHFLLSNAPCLNKKVTSNLLTVRFPNGQTMESTHTAFLDIPELTRPPQQLIFFQPWKTTHCSQWANYVMKAILYCSVSVKSQFWIQNKKILMKGRRDSNTGLWRINVCQKKVQTRCSTSTPQNQISAANKVYDVCNTGALVNYLHKAMFIFKSALIHAVKKGHLATWPGLTEDAINKYLKLTPATTMGHINQKWQNIRSTNKKVKSEDEDITPQGSGEHTHLVFAVVLDQGQIYTDLTGNFPAQYSKGNNVIMVCYYYESNYIRPISMKSKSGAEWVRSFGIVFYEMISKGFKPKMQTMDNEASVALKNYFTEKEMNYQLVPALLQS